MSYCYGCKNDIDSFNNAVSACRAPESLRSHYYTFDFNAGQWAWHAGNTDYIAISTLIDSNYQGNINDSGCGIDGFNKYPGLYKWEWMVREFNAYFKPDDTGESVVSLDHIIFPQFNPIYWAGIDCNGLVTRVMQNSLMNFGVGEGVYMVQLADISNGYSIVHFASPYAIDNWGSSTYFNKKEMTYYIPKKLSNIRKLHKGDLVHYEGHISIIYSDNTEKCNSSDCQYEIIHAYGSTPYSDPENPDAEIFSRKVIKTKQKNIKTPVGYGRIKLWD